MNYGEMKTNVRILLGDTGSSNNYYTDTEVANMINESVLRVASDVPVNFTYKQLTPVDGTQTYGLPTDFLQVKDVQLQTSSTQRKQLINLGYDEFEWAGSGNFEMTGEPAYFRVEFGATSKTAGSPPGDIWLYPVPNAAASGWKLRLVFYKKPETLSADADVSELPETMHMMVCYHSAWHLAMRGDNSKKINTLAAMYRDAKDEAKKLLFKSDRTGMHQARTNYGRSTLHRTLSKRARRGPLR